MRRILFIGLALCGLFPFAQEQAQNRIDSVPPELAKKIFIYNASKLYNDPEITKLAIYGLLAENPANYALRDSLALLYLQEQNFASAALVAQEVAELVPGDVFAAQIAATALERLGVKDRALGFYEKLSLNDSENLNYIYKVAFLQYELERYEEAIVSAARMRDIEAASSLMLVFPTPDQQGQQVSMRLAAIRLMGMIEEGKGNKDKAREHYNAILTEMPNFEVIKQQLTELDK